MNESGDNENDLDKVAEVQAEESDVNKGIVIKNIEKTHPIGKIDKKDLQRRIVKFTSDCFKEKVFKKRKKNEKKIIEDRKKKNNNQSMLKLTCNLH